MDFRLKIGEREIVVVMLTERSPYSIWWDWKLTWTRRTPNRTARSIRAKNPGRYELVTSVAAIGLILRRQAREIYFPQIDDRTVQKHISILEEDAFLVRHVMERDGARLYLLTLGPAAPNIGLPYRHGHWINWTERDVLQRIVFFEIVRAFQNRHGYGSITVHPAFAPFTGAIGIPSMGRRYLVYVARGPATDLETMLSQVAYESDWDEPIIIAAERISDIVLPPLPPAVRKKIRLVTDLGIIQGDLPAYEWNGKEWV